MGRPSLAAERTEQIMQATRACLREYGLAGTTLERVSDESGLSRSHVRHYVGNRDDLLRRFADWLFAGYESALTDLVASAEPADQLSIMLDYLFGEGFLPVSDDDTVVRELITAGLSDESLRAGLQARYDQAVSVIASAVKASTGIRARDARPVAYGIWCVALGNSTMAEIGLSESAGSVGRWAAEALVAAQSASLQVTGHR